MIMGALSISLARTTASDSNFTGLQVKVQTPVIFFEWVSFGFIYSCKI